MVTNRNIIIFILCLILFHFQNNEAQNQPQKFQTYISKAHQFIFEYPQSFSLKEYYQESINISESKDFSINLDVVDVAEWYHDFIQLHPERSNINDKLKTAAIENTMLYNMADGPDGSFYSDNPNVETDYYSDNGLHTIKFYLNGIYEDYEAGTKTTNLIGPFYGIDISTGNKIMLLIIHPFSESLASPAQQIILKRIANSVKRMND